MDRSDPEAMAAERHQDRLDEDADARDVGRWTWTIGRPDGFMLQNGEADSPEEAYEALAAGGPQEDDVSDWEDRLGYERFWAALQQEVPVGGYLQVTDPAGVLYTIMDTAA